MRSARAAANRFRTLVQIGVAAVTNGYVKGFADGSIYTGPLKAYCVPGLNCYSCPGAFGSCPIGAAQAVIATRDFNFSYYLTGFFLAVGALLGRFVCGWLCPFGLAEDLLYRIPAAKKITAFPADRYLRLIKYGILLLFVVLLPMLVLDIAGQGEPWFCKWICPSGTLFAGWPLVLANEGIRQAAGFLFAWKSAILIALILLSVFVYRPFCRYLCPLGAIYGLFNPIALYRHVHDSEKCTKCGACQRACRMNIRSCEKPNSAECIRCGNCVETCGTKALSVAGIHKKKELYNFAEKNDILNR